MEKENLTSRFADKDQLIFQILSYPRIRGHWTLCINRLFYDAVGFMRKLLWSILYTMVHFVECMTEQFINFMCMLLIGSIRFTFANNPVIYKFKNHVFTSVLVLPTWSRLHKSDDLSIEQNDESKCYLSGVWVVS